MGQMHPRKPFSMMNDGEHEGAAQEAKDKLDDLKHRARDASLSIQDQIRSRPATALAVVAASSFVLGSVLGSRVARTILFCAAGYGLSKIIGPGKAIDPTTVMRGWTEPGKD